MEECLKLTLLHGRFSCFLNCTNATKSRNVSQMEVFARNGSVTFKKILPDFRNCWQKNQNLSEDL